MYVCIYTYVRLFTAIAASYLSLILCGNTQTLAQGKSTWGIYRNICTFRRGQDGGHYLPLARMTFGEFREFGGILDPQQHP